MVAKYVIEEIAGANTGDKMHSWGDPEKTPSR
jgi:hypothetical protein